MPLIIAHVTLLRQINIAAAIGTVYFSHVFIGHAELVVRIVGLDQISIYRDERFHSGFPACVLLSNGTILICFRRAPDDRYLIAAAFGKNSPKYGAMPHVHPRSQLVSVWFDQNLDLICDPRIVTPHPEAADQDGSLFVRDDDRVLLVTFSWYPLGADAVSAIEAMHSGDIYRDGQGSAFLAFGAFTRVSYDKDGFSWAAPRAFGVLPKTYSRFAGRLPTAAGAVRGRIVRLNNDMLGIATYFCKTGERPWYDAFFFVSSDGGESWTYKSRICAAERNKIGFAEPTLIRDSRGVIHCFMRTIGHADKAVVACSHDEGATWEPWRDAGWAGHPTDAYMLEEDRILLVYTRRFGDPPALCARVIEGTPPQCVAATEVELASYRFGRDCGYPSVVPLAEDHCFAAVHYQTEEDGTRSIVANRFRLDTT